MRLNCSIELRDGRMSPVPGRPVDADRPPTPSTSSGFRRRDDHSWAGRRPAHYSDSDSARRLRQRAGGVTRRQVPHPGALSRRLHDPWPGAPVHPGVLSRRYSSAIPSDDSAAATPRGARFPTGPPSSSTYAPQNAGCKSSGRPPGDPAGGQSDGSSQPTGAGGLAPALRPHVFARDSVLYGEESVSPPWT